MKLNLAALVLAACLFAPPVLLAQPAAPAPAASPEKLALARRLLFIDDFGSFAQRTQRFHLSMASSPAFSEAPAIYEASVRKAVAAHNADLTQVGEERVALYAAIYTDEDLRAILAYHESPMGQAIAEKFRMQSTLTPEELAFRRAFLDGPVKAADARITESGRKVHLVSYPLEHLIYVEAVLDFCATGGPCDARFRAVWEEQRKEAEAFKPYRGPRATEKYALALRVIQAEEFSAPHMIAAVRAMGSILLPDQAARDAAMDKAVAGLRSEIAAIEDESAQRYVMAFSEEELRVFLAYLDGPLGRSYFAKDLANNFGIGRPGPDGGAPPNVTRQEAAARDAYFDYLQKIPTAEGARSEAEKKILPVMTKLLDTAKKEYCTVRPACQQEMQDSLFK